MPKNTKESNNTNILADDGSYGNNMVSVIATIILTMVTVSGVAYFLHLKAIDKQTQALETIMISMESRIIAEVKKDHTGVGQIKESEDKLTAILDENSKLKADIDTGIKLLSDQKISYEKEIAILKGQAGGTNSAIGTSTSTPVIIKTIATSTIATTTK
ncbi:MAG: hypothetical protein NT091_03210 [Candidatus Falkowbacteria bacterium]|nr:hypothetical protein [Candidatus Falkowbacteria bacterium]